MVLPALDLMHTHATVERGVASKTPARHAPATARTLDGIGAAERGLQRVAKVGRHGSGAPWV